MKIKLYSAFALIAIASAIIALVRIVLGHDVNDAVVPNIIIGSICLTSMMTLSYKERRKIERRN